jgi:hypothetical protein
MAQKGQTTVEYLLILVVAMGIATTAYRKLRDYLLDNPNSYINQTLGQYSSLMNKENRYKDFRLLRFR